MSSTCQTAIPVGFLNKVMEGYFSIISMRLTRDGICGEQEYPVAFKNVIASGISVCFFHPISVNKKVPIRKKSIGRVYTECSCASSGIKIILHFL
jgi:hypothetical protein